MSGIKFSFFAYGILAIAALALFLSFAATERHVATGSQAWGSFSATATNIAVVIVGLFLLYMFLKLILLRT